MSDLRLMIYGANGYTGALVAEEAVARGHRPILAGRSEDKVAPIAARYGLDHRVFGLDDGAQIAKHLDGIDLVFHAAGPFVFTSPLMIQACLMRRVNYCDVTGEIKVFQHTFSKDIEARSQGVCLMSGVGFDVIPTDCLAKHVASQVPGARTLQIAFASDGTPSGGTLKSMLEAMPDGGFVRKDGKLVSVPSAAEIMEVRFADRVRTVMTIPWGDLETAFHSTGIGDIETYMAQPARVAATLQRHGDRLGRAIAVKPIRRTLGRIIDRAVPGPTAKARLRGTSQVWAKADDGRGHAVQAWLTTMEGYRFTAIAGVRSAEAILERRPTGALTPSLAFGADFVLTLPETTRHDTLST